MNTLELADLAHGANAVLPPGTMSAGPVNDALWRELRNLRPHDGYLRAREELVSAQAYLGARLGPPTWLDDENQEVVLLSEIQGDFSGGSRFVMVTTRELYLWSGGTWYNVTPRYETGTVSIANGTNTLTGVGTLWLTHNIRGNGVAGPGQAIELPRGSGDWYQLNTVSGESAATLTTNYTGTTLAGANYSIRRTFAPSAGGEVVPAFTVEFNGDIYVAGLFGVGVNTLAGNIRIPDGAVLKINGGSDLLISTFTGTDTDFVMSGHRMTSGGDYLGYLIPIYGMQALPDGRLVVAVHWLDLTIPASGTSRLLYSSHLNVTVWTTSPGGFVDVLGNSKVTALRRGTRSLYAHFVDGIQVAAFTGADDPPLDIQPTRATVGAISPKMIQRVNAGPQSAAGDVFVAVDHRIYSFSGDTAVPVKTATNGLLSTAQLLDLQEGFSRYDSYRNEVSFAWRTTGRTLEMRVPLAGDSIYEMSWPGLVYEAQQLASGYDVSENQTDGIAVYGMTRMDDAGAETDLLFEMREVVSGGESIPDNTGTTPVSVTPQALTDYLVPSGERAMRLWAVVEVVVWVKAISTPNLNVDLLRDGSTVALTRLTAATNSSVFKPIRFLAEEPQVAGQNALLLSTTGRIACDIGRIQVFFSDLGSARAGAT